MASKDNFLLNKSHQKIINELSDNDAGKLFKGIFNYVNSHESGLDGLLNAVFIPIKEFIDSNEEKYQRICERNRKNGLEGGRPNGKPNETQINPVGYFGKNTHISYIHNNHLKDNRDSNRGMGEEEEKEENFKTTGEVGMLMEIVEKILKHLNEKTGSKFKASNKYTQEKIITRLNEGYKLDDFIAVIDKKTSEWLGTEFQVNLSPDVLFGRKFEKYVNQKIISTNKQLPTRVVGRSEIPASPEELKEMEELLQEFKRKDD